jgi:hypothetical protein
MRAIHSEANPQSIQAQTRSHHKRMVHWARADDAKLLELIRTGDCDPHDRSKKAIKKLNEHWPHRVYKAFAELVRMKLKRYCAGLLLNGRRGEFVIESMQYTD